MKNNEIWEMQNQNKAKCGPEGCPVPTVGRGRTWVGKRKDGQDCPPQQPVDEALLHLHHMAKRARWQRAKETGHGSLLPHVDLS